MENKKLVSVRIDAKDLKEIDRICESMSYPKRSDLIQAGVKAIIEIYKAGLYPKVLRYSPQFGDVIDNITFEYHREHK